MNTCFAIGLLVSARYSRQCVFYRLRNRHEAPLLPQCIEHFIIADRFPRRGGAFVVGRPFHRRQTPSDIVSEPLQRAKQPGSSLRLAAAESHRDYEPIQRTHDPNLVSGLDRILQALPAE